MTLRDQATAIDCRPTSVSKIDRLLADHEDRADEIRDLLLGVPHLTHVAVAKVLSSEFGVSISSNAVKRWRSAQ